MNTTPRTTLPDGMAVIGTSNGRWFAAIVDVEQEQTCPYYVTVLFDPLLLPPALGEQPVAGEGFPCQRQARDACWSWSEAARLPVQWERLAACTEVYPERTVWYREEIARLTAGQQITTVWITESFALGQINQERIIVKGETPDEIIVTLYERVYAWWQQSQSSQAREPLALTSRGQGERTC